MLLMRLNRRKDCFLLYFLISMLAWIGACSCYHESDKDEDEAQTRYGLRLWGDTLAALVEAGEDVQQFNSCEELLSKYKESDLVWGHQLTLMKQDYWGKPFKWNIIRKPEKSILVNITSTGRNGVFENGKGDDLYMEIEYSPNRMEPKIRFSPTHRH